jgi:hypothetical protein
MGELVKRQVFAGIRFFHVAEVKKRMWLAQILVSENFSVG